MRKTYSDCGQAKEKGFTRPKKKKKIQGNTGSGGAAMEWMQFTAENANAALFGASVS